MFTEQQAARFWARVQRGDGCWEWQATLDSHGYGVLEGPNRRQWKAHRAAFLLTHGRLPEVGRFVCHRCDNPRCVRPDHLYDGDAVDNNRDTVKRGRRAAPKTHCKRGHEFTPENTWAAYSKAGVISGRRCRICTRALNDASYRRHGQAWYATWRATHPIVGGPDATHCRRGHEYTAESTRLVRGARGNPVRQCQVCRRARGVQDRARPR